MDDHYDGSDGFPHLRSSEARLSFLLRLSDALRPLDDALEIQATASRILVAELKADRVGYADVVSGSGDSRVVVNKDAASGIASLEGVYKVAEFESELCTRLRTGRIDVHADVLNDEEPSHSEKRAHRAMSIGAKINVPLFDGQWLSAFFFLHYAQAHTFSAIEIEFLRETAERAWFAIEGARTKAALRESEARLTAVLESVPVGIAMRDADGTILVANAEYRRYLPKPAMSTSRGGELPLWHAWDLRGASVAADEFPRARAMRGEATVPGREMLYGRDGSQQRWVSVAGVPLYDRLGRVTGQVEAISDIDALKRGAEALRESEARAQLLIDGIAVATWATAHDGLVEEDSPSWRSYTGQSFDDYKGRGWLSAAHPEDRPDIMENWTKALREEGVFDGEYRLRGRDGSYRWVNRRAVPLRDVDGRVLKWLGINIDVDDQKRLERALCTAERRTRALMEGIPQLMWRADREGEWTWASPQWTEYTGLSEERSCMTGWLAAVHPDDRPDTMSAWEAAAGQGGFEVEHRPRGYGGDYRWFLTRVVSLRDEAGVIVEWLGTANDIDDLRQAQARQSVMVTELQHRTRNLIAVVLALFEKSIGSAVSVDQIEHDFSDRLKALSRVQGLLSNAGAGRRVSFDELIESELTALSGSSPNFFGGRILLSGPRDVSLRSSAVQTLALALHELGTNALKYGALASAYGRLTVKWWLEHQADMDGACLVFEWVETGIAQQVREGAATGGYGKELIERALPFQLKAETRYELTADSLLCTIRLPFGSVVSGEIRS